jgi:hypothetical protein
VPFTSNVPNTVKPAPGDAFTIVPAPTVNDAPAATARSEASEMPRPGRGSDQLPCNVPLSPSVGIDAAVAMLFCNFDDTRPLGVHLDRFPIDIADTVV